jgi:hypothetical protein
MKISFLFGHKVTVAKVPVPKANPAPKPHSTRCVPARLFYSVALPVSCCTSKAWSFSSCPLSIAENREIPEATLSSTLWRNSCIPGPYIYGDTITSLQHHSNTSFTIEVCTRTFEGHSFRCSPAVPVDCFSGAYFTLFLISCSWINVKSIYSYTLRIKWSTTVPLRDRQTLPRLRGSASTQKSHPVVYKMLHYLESGISNILDHSNSAFPNHSTNPKQWPTNTNF